MNRPILLRGARQLLTMQGPPGPRRGPALGSLGIIESGAVLISGGVIQQVGSGRRVENLKEAADAIEIDVTGRVVMPGFVDSHTHLVTGPPRLTDYENRLAGATYQEIAAAGGGILWSVRAVRASSPSALSLQVRGELEQFTRHGTTTVEAKSGYGLDRAAELKTLRVLSRLPDSPVTVVPTYLGAHAIPPEFALDPDGYIDWMIAETLPEVARLKLARFADVYCEPGAFTLEQSRRYLRAAAKFGLTPKLHADQFSSSSGARLAVEAGAQSADHLEHVLDDDIRFLAASPVIATLLPGSVFHLGLDRYAPARALIQAGAAVALATDFNPGTSPTCSMPMILALACSEMRMTPAEAAAAATINGAHALGVADKCGSIEYGKDADLIVLNVSDYREIPYHFGVNSVAMTIKKGRIVYREGKVEWPEGS